ncbi:reverse transcriptase domain-containing protein, partial [Tanacetum coccineum]
LWCSYWLYILIRTGDYVLLLVISFLLVALYVPAGRLSGSYWSGYGFYCFPYSILFVIATGIIDFDGRLWGGREEQTNPQGSVRTTSVVDLEEFCEKNYEKLLQIMADKYEYEKRKKEKLEEVKARLDFGDARKKSTKAQESAYSESKTISLRRQRRSRSPHHNPSVFTRLRRERSKSPRHEYKSKERRESTVFKILESRGRSTSAHSDSRQKSSRYTENYSEEQDSEGGHWKSKLRRKKSSVEDGSHHLVTTKGSKAEDNAEDISKFLTRPRSLGDDEGAEGPLIIEAEIGGHQVHRMCIDGGSSFEILYEHCFNRLCPEIRNQMVPAATSLVGFSGEIKWPLGQITLLVKVGDDEHSTSTWMDFMVVRSTSPYNGIIGRPGLRKMKAVPSTTHGMIKFPVMGGTLTLRSSKIIPIECVMVSGPEDQPPPMNKVEEERIKVAINPEHTEQTVMIGSNLTERARAKLCDLLQRNVDVFAWTPKDMTGVPRHVAEHSKLVTTGIMREVHYYDWLSNPVMVKKHDDSWRMCVNFKDLNKACPKDGYPLPEIDWKVESLYGFPFKCFLDAYKGYHQIQMAEEDEEKTTAFHGQIGRNLEVYVDDLVIKSHTEDEVVRDIEETFRTLRKINMKLNPKKCTFGVEE